MGHDDIENHGQKVSEYKTNTWEKSRNQSHIGSKLWGIFAIGEEAILKGQFIQKDKKNDKNIIN